MKKIISIFLCALTFFGAVPAATANASVIDSFVDDAYFIDGIVESNGQQDFDFQQEAKMPESESSVINGIKDALYMFFSKAIEWLCKINFKQA